jgi:hypothetical protein
MARSKIDNAAKDLISDDGSILLSLVMGEQIRMNATFSWITSMAGYTNKCRLVEGLNEGDGLIPTLARPSGVITEIPLDDVDVNDNTFVIVFPQTIASDWTVKPTPNNPVYGFIDLEIADAGVGNQQQVWKPLRGLIQVLYSPTEAV